MRGRGCLYVREREREREREEGRGRVGGESNNINHLKKKKPELEDIN